LEIPLDEILLLGKIMSLEFDEDVEVLSDASTTVILKKPS
jgi:hypothetical protein